jgi:hypothetical protein
VGLISGKFRAVKIPKGGKPRVRGYVGWVAGIVLGLPGAAAYAYASASEFPAPASAQPATDFSAEVQLLSRLAACTGNAQLPEAWPRPMLDRHCALLKGLARKYRAHWIDHAQPFLAHLVPADLPKAVVYPFGGGDLMTALATFPSADEFTTISLEPAGDIRGLSTLTDKQLRDSLDATRAHLRSLFAVSHSKTTNLRAGSRSFLPGEIAFALVAFDIFDFEPVSLRYFRLDQQGHPVYAQASDLGPQAERTPQSTRPKRPGAGPNPVADVEITFRQRNHPSAPLRVYRHFAANLENQHFTARQPLALHLAQKGQVAALVKAASYLLWFNNFSHIRTYLLDHAQWMISDSTGIQPSLARAAGFEQECYGVFDGPYLAQKARTQQEFTALWQASPRRALPFFFGYPDSHGNRHLMVTRRSDKTKASPTSVLASDQVSGGTHWRLATAKGPVHVWQPSGYDSATAGVVVYVHGYYTNVDNAWVQHALAEQFAASKANALFIVPEAPSASTDEVLWPRLGELLAAVEQGLGELAFPDPDGHTVVVGHSGAWRTLGSWADEAIQGPKQEPKQEPKVDVFLLLDALYGLDDKFVAWLGRHPDVDKPRMTLVSRDTSSRVLPFLAQVPAAKRRSRLPASFSDLSPAEKTVPVLEIRSDLGHMEIVTSGKVLPVLLRRSALRQIKAPTQILSKRKEGSSL